MEAISSLLPFPSFFTPCSNSKRANHAEQYKKTLATTAQSNTKKKAQFKIPCYFTTCQSIYICIQAFKIYTFFIEFSVFSNCFFLPTKEIQEKHG
jgi:hypothetical protein